MSRKIDLTGKRFGKLTVIKFAENDKYSRPKWLCKCDCGNEKLIAGSNLRGGYTKSCGCYTYEMNAILKNHFIHGGCGTHLYQVWKAMKKRCYNSNDKFYKNYGGKGIKVCTTWKNNFASFREWANNEEQANNKSTTKKIEYNGKFYTITDLAKIAGIERAINQPIKKRKGMYLIG